MTIGEILELVGLGAFTAVGLLSIWLWSRFGSSEPIDRLDGIDWAERGDRDGWYS